MASVEFYERYRDARAKLIKGMEQNLSEGDPLAGLMEGLIAVCDVLPLVIAKASEPISEEQFGELGKIAASGAASGTRREVGRLSRALNRRTAVAVGLAVVVTGLSCAAGGYLAGRASVQADVALARENLVVGLRSAQAWVELIRNNSDPAGAVSAAQVWTDPPTGRKAGAVLLYLDPPKGVPHR